MTTSLSSASSVPNPVLQKSLARPLILGASVSANHFTSSPGQRLALKYTQPGQIKVVAGNGRRGYDSVKLATAAVLADRTAILGVDLFFWDALQPSASASVVAIENIVALAKSRNIPVILGEVPTLMPSMQKSLVPINKALNKACADYLKCRLVPLNQLFVKVATDGFIEHKGQKYTLEQLLPDGLHIATPASEYIADEIERLMGEIPQS